MKPIFIAGPHGSGKTTLIEKLTLNSDLFIKDDFQIDFTEEMETLPQMSIFEKCLIRLYHRFYTAQQAIEKCIESNESKVLLIDRSLYDSYVYIQVEYELGELTDEQYNKLQSIVCSGLDMVKPYTIILNPMTSEVVRRLNVRKNQGTRRERDKQCAREDNMQYVGSMNKEFLKLYSNDRVMHITNNEDSDIEMIKKWAIEILKD